MQKVPTQSGLCIDNGSTSAYNFMNGYFLPDPIEIPPNEKIEVYSSLRYKLRI